MIIPQAVDETAADGQKWTADRSIGARIGEMIASLDLTDLIVATPTDQAAPVTLRQGDQFRLGVIS